MCTLAVDVGLGTTDILLTLPGEPLENAVRLVIPSRTQVVAREIDTATAARKTVVFAGRVMGGGASTSAMKRHVAAGLRFIAGESAALTFADDLERVRARGVEVVSDAEAATLAAPAGGEAAANDVAEAAAPPGSHAAAVRRARAVASRARDGVATVWSGDIDPHALTDALGRLGVAPRVDVACIAVQDHGFSLHGSNRAFRFALWERAVAARRHLADLFYDGRAVPAEYTRLQAAAEAAAALSAGGPVVAADTGPAALFGVLGDAEDAVLVNVGNGHVVCIVARRGRLAGVFEHHTSRLDGRALESRLQRFLAGELTSAAVREDGGHGAVLAPDAGEGRDLTESPLIVIGPRRELLRGGGLRVEFAAPYGDMMLTGCFGLLRAARERGLADVRP